ncbi:MAG: methyltransferase domain-containing protein, partial [Nocardioidaceae bacterium]
MRTSALGHLVCPADKQALALEATEQDGTEVIAGTLRCPNGHSYPVQAGVPRMLPGAEVDQASRSTADSFSAKWQRIPAFGHDDASRETYVDWYLQRFGFRTIDGLRAFLAERSLVLDAGTGLGRDARLYGENSSAEVFGIDISRSVDAAWEHVRHLPNVHLVQADLTQLPFRAGSFDYVACDQVLHHTPDTAGSFSHLVEHVAPGGELAVYVYKQKGPVREFCDDFLRAHYTKSTPEERYEFSEAMALLGKALTELDVALEVPKDIPILGI